MRLARHRSDRAGSSNGELAIGLLYALALESAPYIGSQSTRFRLAASRAFARRFQTPHTEPQIISVDVIAGERGDWARGYALDLRLSGAKARREHRGPSIPRRR
jgi:hypothetical protein